MTNEFFQNSSDPLSGVRLELEKALGHIAAAEQPSDFITSMLSLLELFEETRENCVNYASSIVGFSMEYDIPTEELGLILEDHFSREMAQDIQRVKQIFDNFKLLYSDDPACSEKLGECRTTISAYSDEQLAALDFETMVQPYEELFWLVSETNPEKALMKAHDLRPYFDEALIQGLSANSIHISTPEQN